MRTLTLELLRQGPAHNQLLSPLTDYLALCENHPAVTLNLPFEHNQMLHRLSALSYQLGQAPREYEIGETARVMGDLLRTVPGLVEGLRGSSASTVIGREGATHLRLILSASELALLPFELASAPVGMPGEGQALSSQAQRPVCITREVRRARRTLFEWPRQPRILFAYASPPGFEQVPAAAHLLALRKAVAPWVALTEDLDDNERKALLRKHLVVLPNASPASLRQCCESDKFTHVHLLAHGAEVRAGFDLRHGLALHADDDVARVDIVEGERLASMLRGSVERGAGAFEIPAFVTLASCNSGNQGGVAGTGASVAHALHEAGVGVVVASQFPLSYGGSVVMVESLYEGLLWGRDPRVLMIDLRARLQARLGRTHDWASLTVYAALPENFDDLVANTRIQQAMSALNNAMRATERLIARRVDVNMQVTDATVIGSALELVARAKNGLLEVIAEHPNERARVSALLGSTAKREAELRFHALTTRSPTQVRAVLNDLQEAMRCYWEACRARRGSSFESVQYLALACVLDRLGEYKPPEGYETAVSLSDLWRAAEVQSRLEAGEGAAIDRAWACGNLIELYLIVPEITGVSSAYFGDRLTQASEAADKLVELVGETHFAVFSTRRQLTRYVRWFSKLIEGDAGWNVRLSSEAQALIAKLPQSTEPDWAY